MWLAIAMLVCAASGWLMLRPIRELQDFPTRVLLIVLWSRQVLQAFPEYTVGTSIGGLSLIAITSILMAALLLAVSDPRLFRLRYFLPFYVLFSIIVLSSALNGTVSGLVRVSAKWALFAGILILTYRAVVLFGVSRVMNGILWIMSVPLVLQLLSVVLGYSKGNESDGSTSYIGGYYHEALFASVIFTMIIVSSLRVGGEKRTAVLLLIGLVSLLLANYRTAIISAVPIVATFFSRLVLALWAPQLRTWIAAIGISAAFAALPLVLPLLPERYSDVARFATNASIVTQQPEYMSFDQRMTFSGRIYLWAEYIDAYQNADLPRKIFGFGAEAWDGRMRLYAHNTFISYLFEYGVLGVILLAVLMLHNLLLAFRVRDVGLRFQIVAAHIGFLLFNMATMPLWSNEGLMLYAILLAVTWALQVDYSRQRHPSVPLPVRRDRPQRFRL